MLHFDSPLATLALTLNKFCFLDLQERSTFGYPTPYELKASSATFSY